LNIKGLTARKTRAGIPIVRVHYTADPERDATWVQQERRKYSSQAAWDREQEIIHDAGGGELVFAEILNRYTNKIIVTDPNFEVPPYWKRIAGFDHGKTNPTAALVAAVDCDGTIYCLSEYYQPGLTPYQHMENLRFLPDFLEAPKHADPSIFYRNQAQSEGDFKSISDIYIEAGLKGLFQAQNAELAGMERILEHWRDLEYREPTLKIVCPYDYSRRKFGLFRDGCPNLLWELMRTRREQLSASQLMRRNQSEAIVDKDNHLRDCLKYIVLSLPRPSEVPVALKREEIIAEAYRTGNYGGLGVRLAQFDEKERRKSEPVCYLPRWPPRGE
jgi:hypothetical protein